jgi:hypothetical protein
MSRQIGIGPTLFLLSTRNLAWFFLLISIINIPVLMIYMNGEKLNGLDIFWQMSLGNIGQGGTVCTELDFN